MQSTEQTNYVVCLKWGTKYGPEYVNKLYNMVQRNLTLPHQFICFTENTQGIDKNIITKPLPNLPVVGWWYKPWFLSNELGIDGTALFLDLDLIVFRNINKLFEHRPDKDFVIIRDFNRQIRPNWDRMNSSVFRFKIGSKQELYNQYKNNINGNTKRYPGDQDWMYKHIKDHEFFPDGWVQSYKWEMRGRDTLGIVGGKRNFIKPGEPTILDETCIAVFHGQPNMHEANDDWPRLHWH